MEAEIISFQTTYEELKLSLMSFLTPSNHCFQTTYEELKPSNVVQAKPSNDGFQTTYEELKPGGGALDADKTLSFLDYL